MRDIRNDDSNSQVVAARMLAIAECVQEVCAGIAVDSLGESSGSAADSLLELGRSLVEVGDALSDLCVRSSVSLLNASGTYVDADELSAAVFWGE